MKKTKLILLTSLFTSGALFAALAGGTLKTTLSTYTSVTEPSALAYSLDKKSLMAVSDNNGSIYQLNFDGKVLNEIKTASHDLEGITAHPDLKGFCVVEERVRNIVCMDQNGKETKRKAINFQGESNSGLEGITYNPKNKHFYVVNEKKPVAILALDPEFNIVAKFDFPLALDLSDIFYDETTNQFWLLSHESKEIYVTNAHFQIEQKYSIPKIVQAEGITVDSANKKIYIISDKDSSFTVFQY